MAYLVFARKYRPQTFDQVVGQPHVTQTLSNAVSSRRVAHAILFSGPRGTGKTTVARILAKAMNCKDGPSPIPCNQCQSCMEITAGHSADVFEIDGASNNSVDQIRELRDNIKYMPANSAYKIYIIDEVHMLSIAAFNALLKTLEEPPAHILFFFATTEPHKIPITILSRCQRYDFRRIDAQQIVSHMAAICTNENVPIPEESLWVVAREADGSMRDALSLLDQVVACSHGEISHGMVLNILGVFDTQELFAISKAICQGDVAGALEMLDIIYQSGKDLKKLYHDLMAHFRDLFIIKTAQRPEKLLTLQPNEIEAAKSQLTHMTSAALGQLMDLLAREEGTIRFSTQPRIAMEMAFIRMARLTPALPIEVLIDRLDQLRSTITSGKGVTICDPQADFGNSPEEIVAVSDIPDPPAAPPDEPHMVGRVAPHTATLVSSSQNYDQTWQQILNMIAEQQSSLAPNLAKSRLVDIVDHVLTLEIKGNSFNLSRIKRPKNMKILKRICSEFFGKEVDIALKEKVGHKATDQKNKTLENKIKTEALDNPLVTASMHLFNGKVVDVKVLNK